MNKLLDRWTSLTDKLLLSGMSGVCKFGSWFARLIIELCCIPAIILLLPFIIIDQLIEVPDNS